MPSKLLKKYAEESGKTVEEAEECWEKAKKSADKTMKEKDDHYWAYVNLSTRRCLGLDKQLRSKKKTINYF